MTKIKASAKPNFANFNSNKVVSKKREFNNFSLITDLVKKYKKDNSQHTLLAILENLSGIINTYTIICAPSDINQNIHITPYMTKFLGMFLTKEERANANYAAYSAAIQRIRWILRKHTYEDIYGTVVEMLINIVSKIRIIGDCDCIYYIQMLVKYKLYDMIVNTSKDASVNTIDYEEPLENDSGDDVVIDNSCVDYFAFCNNSYTNDVENDLIENIFYNDISISILIEQYDVYKYLSYYDRYLIYLRNGLELNMKQIASILRHGLVINLKEYYDQLDHRILSLLRKYNSNGETQYVKI